MNRWNGARVVLGLSLSLGLCLCLLSAWARAGEIDRIEGDQLARLIGGPDAVKRASLTPQDVEALPAALHDTRSAFIIVKTSEKNLSRLLISPGFRKPAGGEGAPLPIFVLERLDTFEPGRSGSRLAKVAGLIVFEGFEVDLDTGQVVPRGEGGDLTLTKGDDGAPVLKSIHGAEMFSLSRPVVLEARPGPSSGKTVLPTDFNGRYQFHADGRWTGVLELSVGADRVVSGRFRSEPNGTSYPVMGEVDATIPQKVGFRIKFPRTEQEYTGYLWTEGKTALAGTFVMLERTFGFYAVRE